MKGGFGFIDLLFLNFFAKKYVETCHLRWGRQGGHDMKKDAEQTGRLLEQMERGSTTAFSQFYDAYIGLVFRVALNTVKDRQEAEDICHDVFLEVYQKPDSYDPERGSVAAWLTVKTRSRSLDRLRKKKPLYVDNWDTALREQEFAPSAEMLVMKRAEREAVHNAMRRIPEEQRHVLYHTYFNAHSHQKLSEDMKRPLGTIKSRIRYGLHNIKKQLMLHGWVQPGRGGEHK